MGNGWKHGYINIVAVMQKYFDHAISGNWSYNPEDYEENQVPLSVMAQDLLTTYKLDGKLLTIKIHMMVKWMKMINLMC